MPDPVKQSCFKPLSMMAGAVVLADMGIDASKAVKCSLEFGTEPVARLVVTYALQPNELERVLRALRAIPLESER